MILEEVQDAEQFDGDQPTNLTAYFNNSSEELLRIATNEISIAMIAKLQNSEVS